MSNIIYPRTVEVSGNLSGNGVFPNNIVLKDNISLSSVSASTGISASLIYGNGSNIVNINPLNVDLSAYTKLTDLSASFGKQTDISSSFALKTHLSSAFAQSENVSSSFAELSKLSGQAFAGPITASSLAVDTNVLFVDSANNRVGINTSTPSKPFSVNGEAAFNSNVYITGALTVDTDSLFVDAVNNKVGIGTVTPDELLHIAGNLKVSNDAKIGYYDPGSGGSTLLYLDSSNGVVGINTDSPDVSTFLDVNGLARFRNNIKLDNGYGISFSSTTPDGTLPTSELLDDYEEGTWTPTATNWNFTVNEYDAKYIKVGSMVNVWCSISASSDQDLNNAAASIGGLPFAPANTVAAFINCAKSNPATGAQNTLSALIYGGYTYIEINTDPTDTHRYYYVFASYRV